MTDTDKNCPHCGVHIDEHPASPCLNAWVATDVMELVVRITTDGIGDFLPVISDPHGSYYAGGNGMLESPVSDYGNYIAPAWEVVEKLNQSGYIVEIINDCVAWSVVFRNIDTDERFTSDWKTSLEVQVCRAAIKAMPKKQDRIDPIPRLEEIAKATAEISTMSSEEAFESIVEGINKVPEQLQVMIDSIVAMQDKWPMPAEGWKQFVEDIDRTNKKHGLNLHINPPDHFDPLNMVDAQEKYAASINKTRGELDENERKQAIMNAVLAQGEKSMEKSILYKMYAADTIKLVKATLQGTTTPMVPFNVDPLDFCREAHKVKDELVSHAMELLENDIPLKQGDGWINIEKHIPEEGQKVLVWIKASVPIGGETEFAFILVYDGGITNTFSMGGEVARATHWMPLPNPPSEVKYGPE